MVLGIIQSLFRKIKSAKEDIKIKSSNYFACNKVRKFYLFFYSAVFIVHLFLPLNWGDDAIFFEKSSQLNLKEFLSGSARPIIDAFTYFFAKFPLLWRIHIIYFNQKPKIDCHIFNNSIFRAWNAYAYGIFPNGVGIGIQNLLYNVFIFDYHFLLYYQRKSQKITDN